MEDHQERPVAGLLELFNPFRRVVDRLREGFVVALEKSLGPDALGAARLGHYEICHSFIPQTLPTRRGHR